MDWWEELSVSVSWAEDLMKEAESVHLPEQIVLVPTAWWDTSDGYYYSVLMKTAANSPISDQIPQPPVIPNSANISTLHRRSLWCHFASSGPFSFFFPSHLHTFHIWNLPILCLVLAVHCGDLEGTVPTSTVWRILCACSLVFPFLFCLFDGTQAVLGSGYQTLECHTITDLSYYLL